MKQERFHNKNMHLVYVEDDTATKYCPPTNYKNINLHPRVALKFKNGKATCPYCGVEFRMKPKSNSE